MPTWAPAPTRRVYNFADFGGVGDNSTDNTPALNAYYTAVNALATPYIGGRLEVNPGVYRFASEPTFLSRSAQAEIVGLSAPGFSWAGGGYSATGVVFRLTGGFELFSYDATDFGVININSGPLIENITFDGQFIADARAIGLKMINRATLTNLGFFGLARGVTVDANLPAIAGGDSSWHTFTNLHGYKNNMMYWIKSAGVNFFGGEIIAADASYVGMHLESSMTNVYGMLIDGGAPAVDIVGGTHNHFYGTKMEQCATGFKLRESGTTSLFNGDKNSFIGVTFGGTTTCFDIGTACGRNFIVAPTFDAVTNEYVFADAEARRQTIIITDLDDYAGNADLSTCRVTHSGDSLFAASQGQWRWRDTNGASTMQWKGKSADGTAVTGPLIMTGTGSPNSVITAPIGSMYLRSDGGAVTTLYIKESTAGSTGWVAK